jgi:hypothetical protein
MACPLGLSINLVVVCFCPKKVAQKFARKKDLKEFFT